MTVAATLIDDLGTDGVGAPPRSNGELIFDSPWQARAFGMAVALADEGAFTHPEFQQALITAIAEWEALGEPVESYQYYDCWLRALEQMVEANTATRIADIDQRAAEFLARPTGHDHGDHDDHHDDHDHGHRDHDDHGHHGHH